MVTSRLDGLNALLVGLPKRTVSSFQRVQNCAARLITGLARSAHITPVLRDLHLLPISHRIDYKILLLVYKCVYGAAPSYLQELLRVYSPPRALRSRTRYFCASQGAIWLPLETGHFLVLHHDCGTVYHMIVVPAPVSRSSRESSKHSCSHGTVVACLELLNPECH